MSVFPSLRGSTNWVLLKWMPFIISLEIGIVGGNINQTPQLRKNVIRCSCHWKCWNIFLVAVVNTDQECQLAPCTAQTALNDRWLLPFKTSHASIEKME